MLSFRIAGAADVDLYYEWSNEKQTRENSYSKEEIEYNSHVQWFQNKIQSRDTIMYLFFNEQNIPVGQVRIDKHSSSEEEGSTISVSIDKQHRGKGYSVEMLQAASEDFLKKNPHYKIRAYVFTSNEASVKSFIRAGYKLVEQQFIRGISSYILEKNNE